jgi:hypothetical protein
VRFLPLRPDFDTPFLCGAVATLNRRALLRKPVTQKDRFQFHYGELGPGSFEIPDHVSHGRVFDIGGERATAR